MSGNPYMIDVAKIDTRSTDRLMQGLGMIAKSNREQRKKEKTKQDFRAAMGSDDPDQVADFVLDNPGAEDLVNSITRNKDEKTSKNQVDTLRNIMADPENGTQYMQDRVDYLKSVGASTDTADKVLQLSKDKPEAFLRAAEMSFAGKAAKEYKALKGEKKKQNEKDSGILSEVQSSKILPGGLVQIVRKDGTTDIIPPEEAGEKLVKQAEDRGAELQGLRSRERESGKRSILKASKLLEATSSMRKNNTNLRKAVKLLKEGANTGPVDRLLPNLRAASVKLQNLQAQLGLDVVGAVTFGALSKGELDLAKSVALPTGLQPEELKKWINDKIEAQEKLATYMEDQAIFLDQGGTPASWIQNLRDDKALSEMEKQQ
ncbi:MAG: hypothetical protein ACC707_13025, partial [Thiohalomonadales bacterium]